MYLPPASFFSETNSSSKIQNYEINSLFDSNNSGFARSGNRSGNWFIGYKWGKIETSVTFNYAPSTFIDYVDISVESGFIPYILYQKSVAQHVQIKVSYVNHNNVTVPLYTKDVHYKNTAPKTLSTTLNINAFVKSINVYLYNYAKDQESHVVFRRFRAYGSYDSGVRFRKGSRIYSLAHEPTATNYICVKRNGSDFKIPLIPPTPFIPVYGTKASPIRIRKNGVVYALKALL